MAWPRIQREHIGDLFVVSVERGPGDVLRVEGRLKSVDQIGIVLVGGADAKISRPALEPPPGVTLKRLRPGEEHPIHHDDISKWERTGDGE